MKYVCKIIECLSQIEMEQRTNRLEKATGPIIDTLFEMASNPASTLHIINTCMLTIVTLLTNNANESVVNKYQNLVLNNFGEIAKLNAEKK